MSSDRERIIEFDASTSIPADGWLAIDSTTEGTRKIQKSAIIGSGSLDTTSQEVIGAINEVNARAATVESMTQAEYDALPDTKLSDNVVRYITDGEPTYDETLWNKVGTDPLDTTAQNCSGAINEINSALSQKATRHWTMLGTVTATGSLTLSHSVTDYAEVLICLQYPYPSSRKIRQSLVAPIDDFINEILFPDFIIANVRCYFGYTYVDDTHINVTSYEKGTLSGVGFTIYGR